MIRHIVIIKLKHAAGSELELDFLQAIRTLADIPEVKNFECHRQISKKNSYDFGVSMEFASVADHLVYVDHPIHVQFVETYWNPGVADFMEIDLEPYNEA
ncbi:Dabb family protein [Candidatus Neomarinimicrobiota bacterium]